MWLWLPLAWGRKIEKLVCEGPCTVTHSHDLELRGADHELVRVAGAEADKLWLVRKMGRVRSAEWMVSLPPTARHEVTDDGVLTVTTDRSEVELALAPFAVRRIDLSTGASDGWRWQHDGEPASVRVGASCAGGDVAAIPRVVGGSGPIGRCGHTVDGPAGRMTLLLRGHALQVEVDRAGTLKLDVGVGCDDAEPITRDVVAGTPVSVPLPADRSLRGVALIAPDGAEQTSTGPRARTLEAPPWSAAHCIEGEVVIDDPAGARLGDLTAR